MEEEVPTWPEGELGPLSLMGNPRYYHEVPPELLLLLLLVVLLLTLLPLLSPLRSPHPTLVPNRCERF